VTTFEEWIEEGYINGWVGAPVCYTHDGFPTSSSEDWAFDEGNDPCMHMVRLYDDSIAKAQVEENHGPSVWRATNQGLGKNE
jgi:hypothetical protein